MISLKMDWLDLLERGTLKSLLQHHSSKASILRRSAFFSGGQKELCGDFLGGPVVKNSPCNAGDAGLIPGQGTKIPYAMEQLQPLPRSS